MAEDQPDLGKGKITIPWKWNEEEGVDTIDLSDPNDLEKLSRKWNQAHGYEKGQSELKTVKGDYSKAQEQLEYWNSLLEEGKGGDTSRVLAALESYGLKLSKSDSQDDEIIMDEGSKQLKELLETVKEQGAKMSSLESALYSKYTTDAHTQLEAKYGGGKYPEYNRKEVEDFANKKGIRDFEDAYKLKYFEELKKMESKNDKDKDKKHSDKVKKVAVIEPGSGELPANKPEKHSDYGKATNSWTSDPTITENLYVD